LSLDTSTGLQVQLSTTTPIVEARATVDLQSHPPAVDGQVEVSVPPPQQNNPSGGGSGKENDPPSVATPPATPSPGNTPVQGHLPGQTVPAGVASTLVSSSFMVAMLPISQQAVPVHIRTPGAGYNPTDSSNNDEPTTPLRDDGGSIQTQDSADDLAAHVSGLVLDEMIFIHFTDDEEESTTDPPGDGEPFFDEEAWTEPISIPLLGSDGVVIGGAEDNPDTITAPEEVDNASTVPLWLVCLVGSSAAGAVWMARRSRQEVAQATGMAREVAMCQPLP
jgi:hypothetical protein